jgi:hypothetical protein
MHVLNVVGRAMHKHVVLPAAQLTRKTVGKGHSVAARVLTRGATRLEDFVTVLCGLSVFGFADAAEHAEPTAHAQFMSSDLEKAAAAAAVIAATVDKNYMGELKDAVGSNMAANHTPACVRDQGQRMGFVAKLVNVKKKWARSIAQSTLCVLMLVAQACLLEVLM